MTTFDNLKFGSKRLGGIKAVVFFPNGYGASIIKGPGTYGYAAGLFELAVLKGAEDDYDLCYDTPITSDVKGHLSESDVTDLLRQIAALVPQS